MAKIALIRFAEATGQLNTIGIIGVGFDKIGSSVSVIIFAYPQKVAIAVISTIEIFDSITVSVKVNACSQRIAIVIVGINFD